jgi:hypothetical protein
MVPEQLERGGQEHSARRRAIWYHVIYQTIIDTPVIRRCASTPAEQQYARNARQPFFDGGELRAESCELQLGHEHII